MHLGNYFLVSDGFADRGVDFLYPARRLVARSSTLSSMPIDISFIITFIGLSFISALLPQVLI